MLRKASPLLTPLLPPVMQCVLGATILRPGREWYLSDLAAHLGVRPSSLQRPLARLTRAGILLRRADGNRVYYRPNSLCPVFGDLTGLLIKTVGVAEPLTEALTTLKQDIRVAFIHGSVAEERERAESDVDIIVVGTASNADLAVALRPTGDALGRAVNFTRYTPAEFRSRVAQGHHFLTAVLKRPRIFLIGGGDELDEVAGRKESGGPADERAGA